METLFPILDAKNKSNKNINLFLTIINNIIFVKRNAMDSRNHKNIHKEFKSKLSKLDNK
jgi:hypothetical protein